MPARLSKISNAANQQLKRLGEQIKQARRSQGLSAEATAKAAGISRVSLHRIEKAEASVTIGAYIAVAQALGLSLGILDSCSLNQTPDKPLPEYLKPADYPQLKKLAWQIRSNKRLSPLEALELYERNWRHLDKEELTEKESKMINLLAKSFGKDKLLV